MNNLKLTLLFALLFTAFNAKAYHIRKEIGDYYIQSDSKDSTVPEGFCKITGTVLAGGKAFANVKIYGFQTSRPVVTDDKGYFSITVDTSETGLYTNHNDYRPAYLENYKFQSGHLIKMTFHIKKPVQMPYQHAVKKPVIYAYSEEKINFRLSLQTEAQITFTYPKLDQEWVMETNKNGTLSDDKNHTFPYLFWEGEMNNLNFKKSDHQIIGNFVEKQNTVKYLEEKLTQMGLNNREQTDFITFWAPQLMKNDKNFIQFLIDEDYEVISSMEISPQPDQIKRVYILFTDASKADERFIEATNQFKSFNRNGFTIVEWGGTELKVNQGL